MRRSTIIAVSVRHGGKLRVRLLAILFMPGRASSDVVVRGRPVCDGCAFRIG